MLIGLFTILFKFKVAYGVLLTSELKFDHKFYSMRAMPLVDNLTMTKLTMKGMKNQEVIWMKLTASPDETMEKICEYDQGKMINLKFKNSETKACFSHQKDIGFQTKIYKNETLSNVHRFQFPKGILNKDIEFFFSHVQYVPKVLK